MLRARWLDTATLVLDGETLPDHLVALQVNYDGGWRAIQDGREVRIIVKPEEIDEFAASRLASEIAHKIEENLDYPGQIKVCVVRETRSVDYAR